MKDGKDAMNRAVVNMGGPDAVEELIDEVEEGIQARMANPNPNPDPNPDPSPNPNPNPSPNAHHLQGAPQPVLQPISIQSLGEG